MDVLKMQVIPMKAGWLQFVFTVKELDGHICTVVEAPRRKEEYKAIVEAFSKAEEMAQYEPPASNFGEMPY